LNIYIPLWLSWAIPLGIYVIGFIVSVIILALFRTIDKAHSGEHCGPIIKDIGLCFIWPVLLFCLWVFSKAK
jgi:hypothetical protein